MKIFAHRGYSARFPESTRAAYEGAVFARADGFECDVRLTRDGEIVCFHDRTLKRNSGIKKAVSRSTIKELRRLVNAITLDELLDIAISEKKDLLIETKHPVLTGRRIEQRVVSLLEKRRQEITDSEIRVSIMSFSALAVRRLSRIYPHVIKVIKYSIAARSSRRKSIAIDVKLLRNRKVDVRKIRAEEIFVWTVNSSEDLKLVRDKKIDGVITDKPHYARKKLIS